MTFPKMTITKDKAIELLEEAVAQRGAEYVYPGEGAAQCHYFANSYDVSRALADKIDEPMCIVGQVLNNIGITSADLNTLDVAAESGYVNRVVGANGLATLINRGSDTYIDTDAVEAFGIAQGKQDIGENWGAALTATKNNWE
jgi:hypothetical protein